MVDAVVAGTQYLGYATRVRAELTDGARLVVDVPHDGRSVVPALGPGSRVRIAIARDSALQLSNDVAARAAASRPSGP